ncbi:MAG TPA: TetR/AcrR family transcriptional regulator, partial [Bacillota bacterium]|nr:TetR/AcrR family transcriptional regulator [Bacillota bacterium]
ARKNSFEVTIREIAAEAGVNVAAINYYFNSKEQLLAEMEKLFLANFEDAFMPLDDAGLSSEEKLIAWLLKAISYGTHYPGMLVLLRDKFAEDSGSESDGKMKAELVARMGQIKQLFVEAARPAPELTGPLFIAFLSAVIFPFVAGSFLPGVSLEMEESEQLEYIHLILNKFKSRKEETR